MLCELLLPPKDPYFHLQLLTCITQSQMCQGPTSSSLLHLDSPRPTFRKEIKTVFVFKSFWYSTFLIFLEITHCGSSITSTGFLFVCLCVWQHNWSWKTYSCLKQLSADRHQKQGAQARVRLWSKSAQDLTPSPSLTGYVTWGLLLNLPEPQCSRL